MSQIELKSLLESPVLLDAKVTEAVAASRPSASRRRPGAAVAPQGRHERPRAAAAVDDAERPSVRTSASS